MEESSFARKLLVWYQENRRILPWRGTRDPYRIWISEIILQQTRVSQGYDYYLRFMERFPDVHALASASEDEVLRCWQGLGYYSRARNLHHAARQIVEAGGFPGEYAAIRDLKGVGDYTAAAIASFAYGLPNAEVDGNVYRVLSRKIGIETPIDTGEGKKYFSALAQELLPEGGCGADYNQAIMDFGAMQCVPKSPDCPVCPLAESCVAAGQGRVADFPVKSRKLNLSVRFLHYFYVQAGGEIALFRREDDDIWKGLYEPMLVETQERQGPEGLFVPGRVPAFVLSADTARTRLCGETRHQLTHRTLVADLYKLDLPVKPSDVDFGRHAVWVKPCEAGRFALPRLIAVWFERFGLSGKAGA